MKIVDAGTFEVLLKEPNADLPYYLSDYHLDIVPEGFTAWAQAIGTGPYQLKKFDPG